MFMIISRPDADYTRGRVDGMIRKFSLKSSECSQIILQTTILVI
jgi:hypothetical protein